MAKMLTAKSVENEKATEKRKEIPDAGVPGLLLIVQPSGDKAWTYRYRFGGVRKRLALGKFPIVSLAQARDMVRAAALKLSEGVDPGEIAAAPAPEPEKAEDLFEGVAEQFLRRHCRPNHSPRYLEETARMFGFRPVEEGFVRSAYARSFCSKWGALRVSALTHRALQDFLDDVVDAGSPILANSMHAALRVFFKWCKGRGIIETNPFLEIRQPAKKRIGQRILTDAELRALWRTADKLGYPKGSAYKALILSGQRRNIVALAHVAHIDRQGGLWTIPDDQEGAKGSGHVLPITAALAAVLDESQGSAPYIFSTTGGKRPLTMGSKIKSQIDALMLAELRTEAEERGEDPGAVTLKDWDNHDIRRTMRTRLSALPVPEGDIVRELVIGHRQKLLHQIYDKHLYLDEKRIALDLWAAKLESIVNPQIGKVVAFRTKAV
jgi:integrase